MSAVFFPSQPSEIEHPALSGLFAYWLTKCRDGALPSRRDIDPLEMKAWLGRISLLEIVDHGADFRFRLHGSTLVQGVGIDMTGRMLSEARPVELRDVAMAQYREVYHRRAPLLVVGSWVLPRPHAVSDRLILPLSETADEVTMLLSAVFPNPEKKALLMAG